MWERKIRLISLACLWLALAGAAPAQAHKLLISAVPEDGGLRVQVFFPDGTPAQEVPVEVMAADGRPSLTGKTDKQGLCLIGGVGPGRYRVAAGDPLGHLAETRIMVPGAAAPAPGTPPAGSPPAAAAPTAPKPGGEPVPWTNILAGLGFIFGVSAFVLVLKLRAEVRKHASGN